MHVKELFSNRLKDLRGKISIKDLATQAGLSPTALYKAEGGEDSVMWKTIEAAYGDLCKHPAQYEELLMLWAMTQSERQVSLYKAQEALTSVMEEAAIVMSKENAAVFSQMALMSAPDQRIFTAFAKHFRMSEHTRKIAVTWMECSAAWAKEMTRE